MKQKRVLAINDISCVGKCSLTTALPIISVTGIETNVLPTAVLSTHTGGFTGYTFRDLTDDIPDIIKHWKTLNLDFAGIYSGYLGSIQQIELISTVMKELKSEDTLIFVDPVMGDAGKLYSKFDENFSKEMKNLCSIANIIVPNITEACFLLGIPYQEGPYTEHFIQELLEKLSELGPKTVCLTGVYFSELEMGAAVYDAITKQTIYVMGERIDGFYHGTGDIFASVLFSAIINEKPLKESLKLAIDFTVESIKRTRNAGIDTKFGVQFEQGLLQLGQAFINKN